MDGRLGRHEPRGAARRDSATLPQGPRPAWPQADAPVGRADGPAPRHAALGRGVRHATGPDDPRAHLSPPRALARPDVTWLPGDMTPRSRWRWTARPGRAWRA